MNSRSDEDDIHTTAVKRKRDDYEDAAPEHETQEERKRRLHAVKSRKHRATKKIKLQMLQESLASQADIIIQLKSKLTSSEEKNKLLETRIHLFEKKDLLLAKKIEILEHLNKSLKEKIKSQEVQSESQARWYSPAMQGLSPTHFAGRSPSKEDTKPSLDDYPALKPFFGFDD